MKAMKKTIAVLLTVCMVISMLAVAAVTVSAEDDVSDGYYLIGNFSNWQVNSAYKLTTTNGEEYSIEGVKLDATNPDDPTSTIQLKVVKVEDGERKGWYPDWADNYDLGRATGTYNIYFRPDGKGGDDWYYNYIFARYIPITGYSLAVGGGNIAFNVYFDEAASVRFKWQGPEYTERFEEDSVTGGKAVCHVPAAEMTAPITVEFSYDGEYFIEAPAKYTVQGAAQEYLNEEKYGKPVADLAKAILIYGEYAQKQFDFRGNDLASTEPVTRLEAYDEVFDNIELPNKTADLSEYGLKYVGFSLFLQSTTTVRFYFEKLDNYTDAKPKFGDNSYSLFEADNGYWYFEISDIGAGAIGDAQPLTVGNASLGSVSALSYVKAAITGNASETLKDTVSAFYGYYTAAIAYIAYRDSIVII